MNGAAFAQEPAPTTTSSLGDAEGGRPLWDDDDGISSWSPGPPAASNRRVPAPTESASVSQAPPDSETTGTKESVQAATSPSIVDGPAAPVPTAPASADTSATGGADTSARRTAGTLPTPAQATPAAPPLDFATTVRQWPELREALVGGRLERVMTLGTAELVDTVGATLVVKVGSGHLKLLDTDQQRRELRGDLVRALGRPVDLRFVDEYVRRERPSGPSANGATPPVPVRVDPLAEAAADPLVQTGLRLFGGPLVRVDGDADSGEDAAEGEASAFYVRPDEDESDEGNGGAVIGRRGLPVRDWYNT